MPRHSGEDDRRKSSEYNSGRDRRHRDREYEFHGRDDKRLKITERDQTREKYQHENQSQRTSVRNYRARSKNEYSYNRSNHKSSRHSKHQYRQRSPSPSDDKSPQQSISQSNSPSGKSTRPSGFDVAPTVAAALPNLSEQAAGVSVAPQAVPGWLQNMNTFDTQMHQVNLLGSVSLFPVQAMTQQATRHARRVYVGGLPPLANEQTITRFFSHIMNAVGGNSSGPGDAVVNVYINHEKKFAFVEMRTVEEASNAMALDGIVFEGVSVRVRRPTDYNPSLAAPLGPSQPSPYLNLAAAGLTPGMNEVDDADRIFLGGVPYYFSEAQIKELLESFGPLRGFGLVKDRETGNSKGYGFCIYKDGSVTDIACAALNGLKVGDKTLTVRRATVSGPMKSEQGNILAQAQQHIAMQKMALGASVMDLPVGGMESIASMEVPTKILCLSDVITMEELMDDVEYKEILEDMKGECQKFGELIDVVIPRPDANAADSDDIGKVFLEYSDAAGCAKAKLALSGRKFGGNTVVAVYYPEERYYDGRKTPAVSSSA
ncbi:splicing factor U2af large subunit A-like [Andrographis paniculata]|uniref:splicing factor U2af large subunit A-like n=1 Tax=Andrographis paniculata TaxID=175694 RepID=UPI0021E9882D|nr:splicing factor U2af large subunit A-like [Andrographis paniculata]